MLNVVRLVVYLRTTKQLKMRGLEFCQSTSAPGTAWCSAYARPSPRHASPWSCRSATGAQRLASVGTLVRVLEPPVKAGISQGRQARRATASYHDICGAR